MKKVIIFFKLHNCHNSLQTNRGKQKPMLLKKLPLLRNNKTSASVHSNYIWMWIKNVLKNRKKFIKLLEKHSDMSETQEWYQANITHIDSVMHRCINLVKQKRKQETT